MTLGKAIKRGKEKLMIKWKRTIGCDDDIYYLSVNGMFSIVRFKGHPYVLYKKPKKYLNGKYIYHCEYTTLKAAKAAAQEVFDND